MAQFSWAVIGPLIAQYFGEFGAEVIKIESMKKPDPQRLMAPFKDDRIGINRSAFFACVNANRYSMSLNLNHPKARAIAKRIANRADIVIDSFTPGVMAKWGLDYESLRKERPDIIMLSTCMYGQTGPLAKMPGYGGPLTAMSGVHYITGWPDQPPSMPTGGAYTDYIVPYFAALVLTAALIDRQKTGKGRYIDLSQYEAALNFVTPLILDYEVIGREAEREGNFSPCAAPHGVYRCKGDDRWCAITVYTDEEWEHFCHVIGSPNWCKAPQFSTLLGRVKNAAELDTRVEQWTIEHNAEEVMHLMQNMGIAAGIVQNGKDLDYDPQLKQRGYYWYLDHPEMGTWGYSSLGFQMPKTPREMTRAPLLGEHTEHVCTKLLGISDEEFIQLDHEGVFE